MPLINNLNSSSVGSLLFESGGDQETQAVRDMFASFKDPRAPNASPKPSPKGDMVTTELGSRSSQLNGKASGIQPGASQARSSFRASLMRGPYANSLGKERRGFVLTSDLWMSQNKALLLHAGPAEVAWTLGLRASTEDIKDGRAHYMQSRSSSTRTGRTYFNLPTAAFTFQSGNILPIPIDAVFGTSGPSFNPATGEVVDKNTKTVGASTPYGLQDFYYFMDLVNQDPLIPSGPNEGAHNYLWVFYTSRQFPQIVLKGFIEPDGISWADSAESPNGFTWSASMSVYESLPEMWDSGEMLSSYADFDFTLF